ncbi:MAG: SurA N-terminal domain-containing protein [Betaproteobacteria bacterium]
MYDLVNKHKRVAQIILFLMMIPFAFFGVDYYFRGAGAADSVATVGKVNITQAEFDQSLRDQQQRARQMLGRNFDPAMFDNPEVRFAVLEGVVNEHLLANKARDERFRISDAQLRETISSIPAFQDDGKFSNDRYEQYLLAQGSNRVAFEEKVRQDMLSATVQEPVASANFVARASSEKFLGLSEQQREVAVAIVSAEPFMKDAKIDEAAVRAFYDKNQAAFQTPELAKVEYLVLSQDALIAAVTVDPADVKKQYEANLKQYAAAEQRTVAHILVPVKPDASEADRAAAKKQAEELLAKARANPAKFGDLARQFSKDPGSAEQGGDLGTFARGTMVTTFEDAAFAAKAGDVLGPVQTEFGYHIIKVNGIKAAHVPPFEEVKAQIELELKRQHAAQKFAASADQFQNLVYEQADSLAGAAKALNLTVEVTPLVSKAQMQALANGNAKLVQALFSPESVQGRRNTEAVEIGPNAIMAARIIEYKPAAPRPFDEIKEEIRKQLTRKAAIDQAQEAGRTKLAQLNDGKSDKVAGVTFGKPVQIVRNKPEPGFPPDAVTQIFMANPDKLPAFVGATNERGDFSIFRVQAVNTPGNTDKAKLDAASARLSEQIGREMLTAYLATLRAKGEVTINQANLEKK